MQCHSKNPALQGRPCHYRRHQRWACPVPSLPTLQERPAVRPRRRKMRPQTRLSHPCLQQRQKCHHCLTTVVRAPNPLTAVPCSATTCSSTSPRRSPWCASIATSSSALPTGCTATSRSACAPATCPGLVATCASWKTIQPSGRTEAPSMAPGLYLLKTR